MKRGIFGLLIIAFVLAFFSIAGAQEVAPVDSTIVATPTTGPTFLDQAAALLAAITPVFGLLVSSGLVQKYVPWLAKWPNLLIPYVNTLLAYLMLFGGGVPMAGAGIFGDFIHSLSGPAKWAGSFMISAVASGAYEVFIRPGLEKLGIKKAEPKAPSYRA